MTIPFRGKKQIHYNIMIRDGKGTGSIVVNEDSKEKYCFMELASIEELKQVIDPVREYMEKHFFDKEMESVPISEIMK